MKYAVWNPGTGEERDDASVIEALSYREAAEKWAERDDCDSAEYAIVSGNDATVKVQLVGDDEVFVFRVSGEANPVYYAEQLRETPPDACPTCHGTGEIVLALHVPDMCAEMGECEIYEGSGQRQEESTDA